MPGTQLCMTLQRSINTGCTTYAVITATRMSQWLWIWCDMKTALPGTWSTSASSLSSTESMWAVQAFWRPGCLFWCSWASSLQWPWPSTSGDLGASLGTWWKPPCGSDVALTFEQHRRGETSEKDSSPPREDWWTGLSRTSLIADHWLYCRVDAGMSQLWKSIHNRLQWLGLHKSIYWILNIKSVTGGLSHCRLQSVTVNSWEEVPTLLNSLRETHPCLAFRFYSDWDCNPMIQCFQDANFIARSTNMLVQLAAFLQESIASHAWPNVALPQQCNVYLNTQKQFVFVHFLTL